MISDLQTTGFFNICVRKWECVFVDLQFAFRRYNIFHLNNHFVVWNAEKYGYVLTLRLLYFFLNKKTRFVLFDRWVLIRLVFFLLFNVVVQFQKFHSQFSLLLFKNPFDLHTFKWIFVVDKKKELDVKIEKLILHKMHVIKYHYVQSHLTLKYILFSILIKYFNKQLGKK